jgi:Raf kinase inhibitor-like YbhB/YbcL family protein
MRRSSMLLTVIILAAVLIAGCGSTEPTAAAVAPPEAPAEEAITQPEDPVAVPETTEEPGGVFAISSSSFADGAAIPERHSCFGDNVSPAVSWSNVPPEASSLLLFMVDPDADMAMGASVSAGFVHWIAYNIPTEITGFGEGVPAGVTLEGGVMQGSNDFAQYEGPGAVFPGGSPVRLIGYDGPCPPEQHRYVIAVYALDTLLDVPPDAIPVEILDAMQGHVLAEARWTGVFDPPL